jgi:carbon monoxide dehydrogenase subunit G
MLKTIAVIVVVAIVVSIAVVLVIAATRPDTFRVARSTRIKAPPEAIFPLIEDFRNWSAWSPYETRDPAVKRSFGATTKGKGAEYAWEGNRNVGSGRMEITDSSAPSKLALDLHMLTPMKADNAVEFTLAPQGDATDVTWAMDGRVPYFAKIVHMVIDMDRMVGRDFEAGLAKLKAAAER